LPLAASRTEKGPGCRSSGVAIVVYKRSWSEIFPCGRPEGVPRKKKEPKKKEEGGLMETAAAVEKPGKFSHSRLQNACWRFAQFPQARRRLTKLQNNKTGQIICYKHRTFLFATDNAKKLVVDEVPTGSLQVCDHTGRNRSVF
jgi:hypothetical protein